MKFDDDFLAEVGLKDMPKSQREDFLKYIQSEVEMRVGEKICDGLSDDEVDNVLSTKTPAETLAWLRENRPDYQDVIKEVVESVKNAIRKNTDRILIGN